MHSTMEYCCTYSSWLVHSWLNQCYMVEYSILCGSIKCSTHFIFAVKTHFLGNMNNIVHLGESHDQKEHLWSHVMNIAYFSSHTTNTATVHVLCFVFIGTAPSVALSMHPARLKKQSGCVYLVMVF